MSWKLVLPSTVPVAASVTAKAKRWPASRPASAVSM
ncbi:hypothetical protein M2165_001231 [Variovorax sp. TBS-050B]|nr:hypothetical protein [Variovorax sp. TBS-050B]